MKWYWIILLSIHVTVGQLLYIAVIRILKKRKLSKWWEYILVWTMPIIWELWWVFIHVRQHIKKRKEKTNDL